MSSPILILFLEVSNIITNLHILWHTELVEVQENTHILMNKHPIWICMRGGLIGPFHLDVKGEISSSNVTKSSLYSHDVITRNSFNRKQVGRVL